PDPTSSTSTTKPEPTSSTSTTKSDSIGTSVDSHGGSSSQDPSDRQPKQMPSTGELAGTGMMAIPALLLAFAGLKLRLRRED
ncbi:MAG: LPXTG cell wall anchor domain-containing protein, partial [Eubacteriales bacterium]|nr:LPXTG cell wall anchor domain-containing protein [Eubacteriales bacterium]